MCSHEQLYKEETPTEETYLHIVTMAGSYGLGILIQAFSQAHTLVMMSEFDPTECLNIIQEWKVGKYNMQS